MKKYLALTVLALLMATPASAESVNDTNIKRTMTAVERAAIQQGFIKVKPGEDSALIAEGIAVSPALTGTPPALMQTAPTPMLEPQERQLPSVITGNHTVMMMAPQPLPEEAATLPAATTSTRPSLIKKDLPYGLVMDGPGTAAYKKKKRRQIKAEEARKADPAPVSAPASRPDIISKEPAALPDLNSLPPTERPVTEMDVGMPGDLAPPEDPFGDLGQ